MRPATRVTAFVGAVAVVAWAFLLQFVISPDHAAPLVIFVAIMLAWVATAIGVRTWPIVGGWIEFGWGLFSVDGALGHADSARWENMVLIGLSLAAAAAGLLLALEARKVRASASGESGSG
ncbi:MAG: hypothetical protein ACYDDF_10595 [Thermoplasmatota archaeon]